MNCLYKLFGSLIRLVWCKC